jgi:hypothetical protein
LDGIVKIYSVPFSKSFIFSIIRYAGCLEARKELGTVPKAQDEMAFGSKIGAQKSPDVISGDF